MERVQRKPVLTDIDLDIVCSYRDQKRYEAIFKYTMVEPLIDDKDWPHTLKNMK
jgi:hypothetical protein